jgi:DNA polymerase III epsilon subunit-like protein
MYRKFSKLDFNSLTLLRWDLIGFKDNKIYPEFWQSYLSCFDSKLKENTEKRVVVFDTETTGLDFRTDVILSIGAVGIVTQLA